jgi:hypothetical protein
MMKRLILLQDIYDMRKRKQDELEFYHKELEKLQIKMSTIRVEMDLTNRIIDMIEGEKIIDIKKLIEDCE